jgi:ATP-dependent helicase/nuclease subunit B
LLKFKTLVKKIGANLNQGEKYFLLLKEMSSLETLTIQAPNPKPPLKFRPQKISITEISKLISNPYDIYAKKILQLKELEKIDFEPSYAEFGSFIHKALEEFIKNSHEEDFLQKSEEIFEKYFLSSEAKLVWWPKFKNIFSDFIQENAQFLSSKNYLEIPVKLSLEGLLISGKIDRVIIDEEGLVEIFDYKTGQVPSKKDVELGINPQLTISALMLLEGMIEAEIENISSEKITTLGYWKLSASSASEIKKICDKNEEVQILVAAAKSGLTKLFQYFADEKNGYIATKNNERSEYKNLARISK